VINIKNKTVQVLVLLHQYQKVLVLVFANTF